VRQIKADDGQASVYIADVTSADQVEGMIADVVNQYGRLDVMFNNAGGAMPKATHELTADDYRSIIALNLDSVFFCTLSALRIMMRQRRGCILSTSSGAGLRAEPNLAAYGAAKAGVINLARNIAVEYGQYGIRSNVITPGLVDTPALRAWLDTLPSGANHFQQQIPSGRLGTAEDIAETALFLVSDEANFINGAVIPVDGGIHAIMASPRP
jgi:3-oxoacyl-[acyl-carrier protein] reductase